MFQAIAECDALGREAFRRAHGYKAADTYVMRYEDREYDSKAIVGVAFGYQFPELGEPKPSEFSSGAAHASRHLARLGFDVDGITLPITDWSLEEVETLVSNYFSLYARPDRDNADVTRKYIGDASAQIPNRTLDSVQRKVSNINSILEELGYVPLARFGKSSHRQLLLTAVTRDWLEVNSVQLAGAAVAGKQSNSIEVPPPDATLTAAVRKNGAAVKVDFAARDERNRALGRAGEEWVCDRLKDGLRAAGRSDLAEQVVWASDTEGDGLGFDIRAFTPDGQPILVEVKTTNGGIAAPFFLSPFEVATSMLHRERYVLIRVFAFDTAPQFYRLTGSLADACQLMPAGFRALPTISVSSEDT